jgi:hypothetical protein
MALASPAIALADSTTQSFTFPRRVGVKVQIRFYTSATGAAGDEIAAGSGSRSVTITTTNSVVSADVARAYTKPSIVSSIENGTQTCNGAVWTFFGLGDGLGQLNVTASGGADPGTANSYRIWLDVESNG